MSPSVPPELLEGVIRHLDPVEVYLFGSRARGDAGPDSDLDLLVVVDDARPPTVEAVGRSRRAYDGPVDILLSSKSRFERRRKVLGTLEEAVDHEGVRVYARG